MQIFSNATFLSMDKKNQSFTVLIEDKGKICFLGNDIPKKYLGRKITDLDGLTVLPGFGDTHLHFISDSFFKAGLDLRGVRNLEELKQKINFYETHKKSKVTIGFGLSPHLLDQKILPTKSDLDKITSRPTFIVKYDGHAGVANTDFINLLGAGIKSTKGFINHTGQFYLDSFYKATDFASKQVSLITLIKSIFLNSKYLAQKGISFLHACEGVGFPYDLDITILKTLKFFLLQKISIFFQTTDLNKIKKRKFIRVGGCFETALDGCFGSLDAALTQSYQNDSNNFGNLYFSQERLNDFVLKAHLQNLQVAIHAIGDLAIEQAVNAFEYALRIKPRPDHRHIIIHACLLNDNLIKRIAHLNIHLAVQTAFLNWPEEPLDYLHSILGDRTQLILPLKKILDNQIIMANGSDAPCTNPDPIMGMHQACNHPVNEQSISVLDAIRMYTIWAARLGFEENTKGSLEVGKCCDLVILDKNPCTILKENIKDLVIKTVYIKGKTVYRADK